MNHTKKIRVVVYQIGKDEWKLCAYFGSSSSSRTMVLECIFNSTKAANKAARAIATMMQRANVVVEEAWDGD